MSNVTSTVWIAAKIHKYNIKKTLTNGGKAYNRRQKCRRIDFAQKIRKKGGFEYGKNETDAGPAERRAGQRRTAVVRERDRRPGEKVSVHLLGKRL